MTVLDHMSVGVPSISEAVAFYDSLLDTIGVKRLVKTDGFAAYGADRPAFLVMTPYDGGAATNGNGTHVAFRAPSRPAVDAFHACGVKNGGRCEGAPGPREGYPNPDVYTAYLRDPFGNKLEIIHNGFSA